MKNPLPYLAPNTNAAFFRSGTMTTHWARSSKSCGMDRSGIAITSLNAAVAASSRFEATEAAGKVLAHRARTISSLEYIEFLPMFVKNNPVSIIAHLEHNRKQMFGRAGRESVSQIVRTVLFR